MSKLGWGLFLILTFTISLPASWWALSKIDFGYSFLHDTIGISNHIDRYAPKNIKGKMGFEKTSKEERVVLFHGTIQAIQSQGEGLEALNYINESTQSSIRLYTNSEITHLQDVANLIDVLRFLVIALFVFWLMIVFFLWKMHKSLPDATQLLFSTLLILILCGALLLLGPEAVFNQLHIWIFPEDHQWFFYYEESLMSTMMKAPDLFAYIAGMLSFFSLLLTTLLIVVLKKII